MATFEILKRESGETNKPDSDRIVSAFIAYDFHLEDQINLALLILKIFKEISHLYYLVTEDGRIIER